MVSYIVRIFRRVEENHGRNSLMDGVVENAEGDTRVPFHNVEELWSILSDTKTAKQNDFDEKNICGG